jgi:hypothetical protein
MGDDDDDVPSATAGYGPGADYVPTQFIAIFGGLLGVLTIGLIGALWMLWPSCEVTVTQGPPPCTQTSKPATPPPPATPSAPAAPAAGAAGAAGAPPPPAAPPSITLSHIQPATGPIAGCDAVTLMGSGFTSDAKVLFGGAPAPAVTVHGASMITAATPPHTKGKVDITVAQDATSTATLSAGYAYTCPAPEDGPLFLMIVLAGALGGALHALQSFVVYVGSRKLLWSWMPNYLLLPLAGASLAVIFYIIVGA